MDSAKPCRRWFRFSLRSLLLGFTLALAMAWIASVRTQSRCEIAIAEQLKDLDAEVLFKRPFAMSSQKLCGYSAQANIHWSLLNKSLAINGE